MNDKLTNKDIAELKLALENRDVEPFNDGDEVKFLLATGGETRLHQLLYTLAPKVVAYFTEQSKCDGCNGTGMKHL